MKNNILNSSSYYITMSVSTITNCRVCCSPELTTVISLGEQYITSRFPIYGDFSTPKTSIDLCVCKECRLLQLLQTTVASELYEYEYGYRSGISNTMRAHLKSYQEEILSIVNFKDGDTVVDIGSNDSTMLQYYSNTLKRIGVDPTGNQFNEFYRDVELIPNYFNYENFTSVYGERKCKLVSSISMFYDLPDPVQFAKDIYSILEEDGIWTCEQSYMPTMLKTNSIDTICHEHLEYYSLKQVKDIADRANFKIVDVKFNDCNGGSFRVYFAKRASSQYAENKELINTILHQEKDMGLLDDDVFAKFMRNCDVEVKKLVDFIELANKNGKKVYVYGASTKGNCLLQYANLGEKDMKYAVERNPNKIGKMTCTGIEIISEETMRENPPDYMLVLPWHFREEIVVRENAFLDGGGQFIFPFPRFEIIGSKPKALITGCDGMIAHYVKCQFKDYNLYGISRSAPTFDADITKAYVDMTDSKILENILSIIKPDVIIHLASISSSQYAFQNPIETLEINGFITAKLCDIIHKNKWNTKLFNASSSEIYKGHVDYEVKENDHNMFHQHPYSIAKIMGHSMVEFYRNTYGLSFSNGVLFTTESPLKKPVFLLNKVANHIREWKAGKKEPICVGNLDSYRNIIHASDVARAIHVIVSRKEGDDYLICGEESHKVYDLVIELYLFAGIKLEKRDNNILYEVGTDTQVVIIQDLQLGFDSMPTNIRGNAMKLKGLGWLPLIDITTCLSETYLRNKTI